MCVAELNVSTQPCSHRWYQLVRSCQPTNNLANCREKLQLEGWENRNDSCPFCYGSQQQVKQSTHRLFGSVSSASSPALLPLSDLGPVRPRRSGSGSDGTMTPLSRHSSTTSLESERGQRHREMNDRLHLYLSALPHEVLPSAKKYYPTYPQSRTEEMPPSDVASLRNTTGVVRKGWRKGVRISKKMLTG